MGTAVPVVLRSCRELCRRARSKGDLTQDEILLLAIAAGQAAPGRYVEPDSAYDVGRVADFFPYSQQENLKTAK